jgi:hypothetical protein
MDGEINQRLEKAGMEKGGGGLVAELAGLVS